MNVEIVTIGDELLLGLTVDTNSAWLARELAVDGVRVSGRVAVADDAGEIAEAVRAAIVRADGVITTGGLGPTADDKTKPAIAALFGRGMRFDAEQWERLRQLWRDRGRPGELPDANRQQVMIPDGAEVLPNRHGTAPGVFLVNGDARWVAMLPGVPREMRGLFRDELRHRIIERRGPLTRVIRTHTVRTTGVAESQLPALLGEAAGGIGTLTLSYLPGPEGVDLRLTAYDLVPADADRQLHEGAQLLRERLARYVYGEGMTDLAEVVLARCRETSRTIAVAESCTGGLLGARLSAVPGASDVLLGGVIAYSNAVKRGLLGVPAALLERVGAVSDEVARAMATGARERLGASIGVGITGIAGPGGGTATKPVGLVCVAVDIEGTPRSYCGKMIGDRDEVRLRATQTALEMIRRGIAE